MASTTEITERLEYLRRELRAEAISMGELIELQGLASHIDPGDAELLEAAGVPEFPEEEEEEEEASETPVVEALRKGDRCVVTDLRTGTVNPGVATSDETSNYIEVLYNSGRHVRVGTGFVKREQPA